MFGKSVKRKGSESLSSSVNVRSGRGGSSGSGAKRGKSKRSLNPTAAQVAAEAASFRAQYSALDGSQRDLLKSGSNDIASQPVDYDWIPVPLAGEEGELTSGAGGEQDLCDEILEKLEFTAKRRDFRTRRDRTHIRNKAWDEQMEVLADAYLHWEGQRDAKRAMDAADGDRSGRGMGESGGVEGSGSEGSGGENSGDGDGGGENDPPGASGAGADELYLYTVDFFETSTRTFPVVPGLIFPNATLLRHGYLGTAPSNPTVAVTLDVLEAYRQLHRVCPRLSVYAQVKALCHLQKIPFRRALVEEFSIAYDAASSVA